MRRRTMAALAAAATLALVATGCSSSGNADSASGSGSTLVYATGEPDHLTPGRQTVAFDQVMSLFAPLTQTDAKGTLHDVAAKSVESDDATTWTITLRDGWKFQNGEEVTPESYVKAWNYVAYGPNAWENSGQLASIVGYSDLNPAKGTPTTKEMSGLKVTGDDTFTVTLTHADSQFPLQLSQAQTAFYPMPAAAYDDIKAYDKKPIGNGPYEMTKAWKANQEFTVTAWKGYEGTKPTTTNVTFRSYSDMNTAYTDVLAGNADVLFLPTDKMTSAKSDFGDKLHSFDAPGIDYIGFPLWDERYSNADVRRAISMSINREQVNKAIYGGLYDPATALTPPSMSGTQEGICGDACEFDPAAAKKLLASAGGFDGTITLVYPGGNGLDSLYEAYANQIRQNLGVDAEAKATTDWASYYSELTDKKIEGPHFGHWGALYISQQNTLRALFTTAGGCAACTGYYQDDTVDSLLAKADSAGSQSEANEYYNQTQEAVLKDFPIVPTFFDKYSYVTSDKVTKLPAVAGSPVIAKIAVK
ncbi:peptide/nickel transport system substrate-binding protein/oligopeptide transport system substrate-binding protein [Curtobacterium sp. PhB130]|uniref:peptide ABC transporter substrate-binding protein n=1 Tax=Curtobacterium sp. PhB130 TaxID=2485178 RepID=UPI000F940E1F|nr:ABC transporter substrate-binding protein [Curtobacterium sp. PhB130]ROS74801.1 peptide/nickel transport system substrate-binding protein/oligopeptide transport system substrate-binding protein [Curtobacterium sp. PhB130]